MSALLLRQAARVVAAVVPVLVFTTACAQGTQINDLNANRLTGGGSAGTDAGGTSAGVDATGGMPTAGDTSMPIAGTTSAGTSSIAGTGGADATGGAGGTAGSGGTGGAAGSGGAGGAAGSAGMSGSGGMAGSGGSGPTGYRYAKLLATSEQSGAVWSSCAELQILTTGNAMISRTGWGITADSQETVHEQDPATAAIDGDTATFWHTEWAPAPDNVNDAKLPHYLIVDMKTSHVVTGFSYLPRQVGPNGHIKDYQFFVSQDGVNWGTAVKAGTFPDVITLQSVVF